MLDPRQAPGQMPEVAARGHGAWRRTEAVGVPARRGFLDLGHRAFQVLERQLAIVQRALLGLLVVDRPAQLADEVFQAAVGIGEQIHPRAKLVGFFCCSKADLLRLEDRPVGGRQRLEIDRFVGRLCMTEYYHIIR